MVKLADTPDLGSGAVRCVGSSPILGKYIETETVSEAETVKICLGHGHGLGHEVETMNHFHPLPGLRSPHLQTIFSAFRPSGKAISTDVQLVKVGNGDSIACERSIPKDFSKIVVMVHGLGGSSSSRYMIRLSRKFYEKGIMAVRVNLRGCGIGKNYSKSPYNAGQSGDLLAVVNAEKEQFPDKEVIVLGFSLGANIALKLAGESAVASKTIAICPPLDLAEASRAIDASIYRVYYLRSIKKQLYYPAKTLFEYDDKVTAPLGGFSGAREYYAYASSQNYLSTISKPCAVVMAEDDPFIPKELIQKAMNKPLDLIVTPYGGHMGFIGYTAKEHRSFWLDEQIFSLIVK